MLCGNIQLSNLSNHILLCGHDPNTKSVANQNMPRYHLPHKVNVTTIVHMQNQPPKFHLHYPGSLIRTSLVVMGLSYTNSYSTMLLTEPPCSRYQQP